MKTMIKNSTSTIQRIQAIIEEASLVEKVHELELSKVHPLYRKSAVNLLQYKALRSHELRYIQKSLRNSGLSGMSKAERHVMASLLYTQAYLEALETGKLSLPEVFDMSFKEGTRRLNKNTKALLGKSSPGRKVRIMVTLPLEAADDYQLVADMMAAGMNTARINCAHYGPEIWKRMVENVKQASSKLNRKIKISMDLGGPKIRTGSIETATPVLRLKPKKNHFGRVVDPLKIQLVPPRYYRMHQAPDMLPLPTKVLDIIQPGDELVFKDLRDKKRFIKIISKKENRAIGISSATVYLSNGISFGLKGKTYYFENIKSSASSIELNKNDWLILHADLRPGASALFEQGNLIEPAHISCTNAEVFNDVKSNQRVYFDDGKIGGIIKEVHKDRLKVQITTGSGKPQKLHSDKGISFPDSQLTMGGLTTKDREDLKFVAAHADMVNYSFVNTAEDIKELLEVLDGLQARNKLGIVLKIETRRGFENLFQILLTAMQAYPIGVMIARGDLAIECGWENLGILQEEIMRICEAAHIPDIWATQVLENLAKKGVPSRPEITDASMSQRAECVMLNKGPYILEAIDLLHNILKNMKSYQDKKDIILPILNHSN